MALNTIDELRKAAARMLRESVGEVVVGPVVHGVLMAKMPPRFYFSVASFAADDMVVDVMTASDSADVPAGTQMLQQAIIAMMIEESAGEPRAIHLVDDELYMAELCASLWPASRATRVLANVKLERSQPAGHA